MDPEEDRESLGNREMMDPLDLEDPEDPLESEDLMGYPEALEPLDHRTISVSDLFELTNR